MNRSKKGLNAQGRTASPVPAKQPHKHASAQLTYSWGAFVDSRG